MRSVFILLFLAASCIMSCKKDGRPPSLTAVDIFPYYTMIWNDEFNGTVVDTSKWMYRAEGTIRVFASVSKKTISLNNRGDLVIKALKDNLGNLYVGQLSTMNKYLTTYGYFECRAKLQTQLGCHTNFWLQSPTVSVTNNDPATNGAEIDIFEYSRTAPKSLYNNLHWNGYGIERISTGFSSTISDIDTGYHTFGLKWSDKEYIFYTDGVETWRTNEGVSNRSQYLILSTEISGLGGNPSMGSYPDSICFDYVRVYKPR